MTETPADPSATPTAAPEAPPSQAAETAPAPPLPPLSVRSLLEAGVHFGHQARRWNPRMKPYIFGERDGIHIIDLDQTLPLFQETLDFIKETVASGGKVLFVGTKRQAAPTVEFEARRTGQYYVNNRWLGGMLTNFRTVKKSIERYKEMLATLEDEEKLSELSKKERARVNREVTKYRRSLEGIKEMTKLPDAIFVIDLAREHIAVNEAQRLGIPIAAVVDTNCDPGGVEFVVPGNDDALRAIQLYCGKVAEACLEGDAIHQERIRSEVAQAQAEKTSEAAASPTGRVVVEINQPARRGRGTHSAGPRADRAGSKPEPAKADAPAETPAAPAGATPDATPDAAQ